MEGNKKKPLLSQTKKNRTNRASYARIKSLSPEERKRHDQLVLWFKLKNVFTKKEYVSYEHLPEALKSQIGHFNEVVYPSNIRATTPME